MSRPRISLNRRQGFTLVELLMAIAVLGLISAVSLPIYKEYIDSLRIRDVVLKMRTIEAQIVRFQSNNNGELPDTLAQAANPVPEDPWGNPLQYLRIEGAALKGIGKLRKDKNLVPINSDYDLYSAGPDGASTGPLTAKASRDDIIRASNGRYMGKAEEY